ncbi:MAG: amidohydrolase family protein [Clostridiales bacterium]|nr:amidohydrolase family protein [Clostridiales bacterium]
MKKMIFVFSFILILSFSASPLWPGGNLLIKNGTILTVTKGVIPRGDVLIIGGIIKQIGENIQAPPGVQVIDASGKFVLPGIIDSHTHIALSGTNETGDVITAEVDMADVLDAEDLSIFTALSGGVTMVHTMHGSANPIGGRNVTIKLKRARPSEELVVRQAYPTLKFALGENPKQANRIGTTGPPRYPLSRMGVNAIIRRELLRARTYMSQWDRYNELRKSKNPPKTLLPPRRDLRLETLAELLRGNLVARCHTYRADETLEFINLSKEFGFKIACFEHIPEAYKIVPELVREGVGISIFLDNWAYKVEAAEGIAPMAAYCAQNGILVSINSDGAERTRRLFNDAAKAIKYGGLSEEEALKLVTLNPAIQLGVEKIAGSLEVGKHGDVAIFNEHPLSAYTRCEMTIIEGDICFDRSQYLSEREEAAKRQKEPKKG